MGDRTAGSQSHRTVEAGRDLWRLPGPAILLRWSQWEKAEQGESRQTEKLRICWHWHISLPKRLFHTFVNVKEPVISSRREGKTSIQASQEQRG